IVELLDGLVPAEDPDIGRQLKRSFEARGIECLVKTKVESVEVNGGVARVTVSNADGQKTLEAEAVLVAVGFVPRPEKLNIEAAGVELERGFIKVDDQMRTNVPSVWAVGDVNGKLM